MQCKSLEKTVTSMAIMKSSLSKTSESKQPAYRGNLLTKIILFSSCIAKGDPIHLSIVKRPNVELYNSFTMDVSIYIYIYMFVLFMSASLITEAFAGSIHKVSSSSL